MRCLPLLMLLACSGLGEFATAEDEIYRGTVLGREDPSFIRRGFPVGLELELSFDPGKSATLPGTITSNDDSICGQFFQNDALLPITPMAHDALSLFEFPGARLQNYIFAVRPTDGPMQNRDIMAFLSLKDDGSIEVRLIAGSGGGIRDCMPTDCEAFARGECDVFGVFPAEKETRE
ncbi:MAG: hypothetical protein ACI9KE_006122 [Polyangiales bacterium]|jgi:hypothetical protein